jgi:type I restriction enzyme, S subunit
VRDEDASALPRGWAMTRLGQIIPKPRPKIPADPHSRLPFIGMDHIDADSFHLVGQDEFAKMKSAGSYFQEGDVLYGRLRPYLNKVHRAKFEGVASAEFIVLPASDFFDGEFIKYLLHRKKFVDFAMSRSSGDRPRVKFDGIAEFEFPLPPLNEQRRIVEKIETLFARLDQGEAALRHTQTLLARYRQSVLKAAVTGALTADWRVENAHRLEHGRDLLARILQTRRDTWQGRGKYQEPAAPDTSNLPELPEGWVWAGGNQLFTWSSGKFLPSKKQAGGAIPVYGGNGINGHHDEPLSLEPTIVIGRVGAHCGNVHRTKGPAWITDNAIYAVQSPSECDVGFLAVIFRNAKLGERSKGGAQPFVNQEALNSTLVPLPPLAEQREILFRLDAELSNSEIIEAACQTELTRSAALRQSILKDAFAGKLVPQDPSDEPAAELLARIRASRPAPARKKARA